MTGLRDSCLPFFFKNEVTEPVLFPNINIGLGLSKMVTVLMAGPVAAEKGRCHDLEEGQWGQGEGCRGREAQHREGSGTVAQGRWGGADNPGRSRGRVSKVSEVLSFREG